MTTSAERPDEGDELRRRRANSFGGVAAMYAEHRPDYPDAAVRWALEPVGLDQTKAVDLAAGTGKLTETLVRLGVEVLAVEPDDQMREELQRQVPGVPAVSGTAEDIPLPDESVDAVLVGQAFHWFDAAQALPEINRVLRHGGVLGLLWNGEDDRVDWVRELGEVTSSRLSFVRRRQHIDVPESPLFRGRADATFEHHQRRTVESLGATLATHSHIAVLPPQERESKLEDIRDFLRGRPETNAGEFDLPIVTYVVRMVRP